MSETLDAAYRRASETRMRLEGRNEDLLIALRDLVTANDSEDAAAFAGAIEQARRVLAGGAATTPLTKPEGGLR